MGFQVDFLPVEAGEKSGDAIALRLWNDTTFWVIVIDGGYTDDGDALVDHINRYYGTNQVNLVISGHPDADHASGLLRVVDQMQVDELWMHRPWTHPNLAGLFKNSRVTTSAVHDRLRRDLDAAHALERAALKKNIPITEPFTGLWYRDMIRVFGPSREFYARQLTQFDCTPQPRPLSWIGQPPPRLGTLGAMASLARIAAPPSRTPTLGSLGYLSGLTSLAKREDWQNETLDDACDTSGENNTSVIMGVQLDPQYLGMFTGDAGEPALIEALNVIEAAGIVKSNFRFVQMPHHGSAHNISRAVLNRWLGPPQASDVQTRTAYVSSARKAPKHPSDKVMNAFRRRGAWPFATEGTNLCHASHDAPRRYGWNPLNPYPFRLGAA